MSVIVTPDVSPRIYQEEVLQITRAEYDSGINRLLWVKATGLGKTITFSLLPSRFPELFHHGVLVIVHTDELVQQAYRKLQWIMPMATIGIEKARYKAPPTSQIVIASRQTLGRKGSTRLNRLMRSRQFGIVIVDEAHHMTPRGQYDNIVQPLGLGSKRSPGDAILSCGARRLLVGVTATPNRHDGVGLAAFFDQVAAPPDRPNGYDLLYGIEQGFLADVVNYSVPTNTILDGVKTTAGDFNQKDLAQVTNEVTRNDIVVSAWRKYVNAPSIAFCSSVKHAHDLAACFNAAGAISFAVDGETPTDIRKKVIADFEAGDVDVLTNCAVLTEGFDAPRTRGVLMARPTKSTPLYAQMLGRGTRTSPPDLGNLPTQEERLKAIADSEKPYVTVLDFVDVCETHRKKVVSAVDLFGIQAKIKSPESGEGEEPMKLTELRKRIDEAIESNPGQADAIREASTFQEVEVAASKVDLFATSKMDDQVKKVTDLKWMALGEGHYQLHVPANKRKNASKEDRAFAVNLREDHLGRYRAEAVLAPSAELGRELETVVMDTYPSLDAAMKDVDTRIMERYSDLKPLLEHSPSWGEKRATKGQVKMMNRLKLEYPTELRKDGSPRTMRIDGKSYPVPAKDLSASRASQAISHALAAKKNR